MTASPGLLHAADERHDGRRKIPALTGVRGIAACWVVLFHFAGILDQRGLIAARETIPFARSGFLGVDLFFVLSGFVLTMTYGREMSVLSKEVIRKFAIGRIFRILPLNAFILLLMPVGIAVAPSLEWGHGPHTVASFLASLLLLQSWFGWYSAWNPSAWSLSAEWAAYFLFIPAAPLLFRIKNAYLALCLAALCLPPLVLIVTHFPGHTMDHAERLGFVRCFCEFFFGCLLCRYNIAKRLSSRTSNFLLCVGALLLLPAMFVGLFEALAPIAFGLIVLSCSAEDSWADTLMGNRPIYLLGEISFSIYIVHRLVLELGQLAATGSTSSTDVVSMMVALVAVIPIAWLTWRYVELPFQAWGRRVAKKNSPKPLSAPLGSTAPEAM